MTTAVPWYLDTLPKGYAPAGRWRDGIVVEGAEFTPAQASFASSVWVSTTDPYTDEDQFDCGWQHARYGDSGSSGLGIETLLTGPYTGCPALGAAPAYWQSVLPFQYANTPYVGDHTETGSVVGDLWSVYFNVVLAEVNVASATSNNTLRAALPDPPEGCDILIEKESAQTWLADRLDLSLDAQLFAHHNYEQAYEAFDSLPFTVLCKAETDVEITANSHRPPAGYLSSWATSRSFHLSDTTPSPQALSFDIGEALAAPAQWQIMFASDVAVNDSLVLDPPHQWNRSAYLNPTAQVTYTTPRYRFVRKGSPPLRQRQNTRGSLGTPNLRRASSAAYPPLRLRQDGAR